MSSELPFLGHSPLTAFCCRRRTQQYGFVFDFHRRSNATDHIKQSGASAADPKSSSEAGDAKAESTSEAAAAGSGLTKRRLFKQYPPLIQKLAQRMVDNG